LYGTAPTSTPSIGQFNAGFNQFGSAVPNAMPMHHAFGAQFGQNHNSLLLLQLPQ